MTLGTSETVPASWLGSFNEAAFAALDTAVEGSVLRAKREEAFVAYQSLATPTVVDEEWRKTPPEFFPLDGVQGFSPLASAKGVSTPEGVSEFDVVVDVDESGIRVHDITGRLAAGDIVVEGLSDAAIRDPGRVDALLGSATPRAEWGKFLALNHAFFNAGLFIDLPAGTVLEHGIWIRMAIDSEEFVLMPHLVVAAGARSEATLVESTTSRNGLVHGIVSAKELFVDKAARLKVIALQEWGDAAYQVAHDMAQVGRDGRIDWITLNFGTQISKLTLGSDVAGEGANAELDGLFFCCADQHIDQRTLQIHSAPNTYSRLLYKGAVQDRGHSVYQGVIQARPGAIKVDAYQTNNNLVLNDGARVDTIPGLLIDADDLRCSHGATIGNLNPEHLFYLRSRGLDESDARQLLLRGFFSEVAERIPYPWICDRVRERIESRTGDV